MTRSEYTRASTKRSEVSKKKLSRNLTTKNVSQFKRVSTKYNDSFYEEMSDDDSRKPSPAALLQKPSASKRISYMLSKSKKSAEVANGDRFSHLGMNARTKLKSRGKWNKKGRRTIDISAKLEKQDLTGKSGLIVN
eukprot:CAMPEP_0197016690 /NCGR_PEP_ID=MMETSP1380-20130617/79109_1 /TAXON_ID=5936 /ORGANISM="Euplotes crassus, Strain CT5" /LENGTH=135 /DNA_ID=CAMNT_0042443669 /DNA_START=456 /DNA_END=863 /DNA_ORIENTATION=-